MDSILLRKIKMSDYTREDKIINKKKLFKTVTEVQEDVPITHVTEYCLYYRIDEDRFWYTKSVDGTIIDEHHTKNGFYKSMEILTGIYNRLMKFKTYSCVIEDESFLDDHIKENILDLSREDNKSRKFEGVFFKQ